MKERFDKHLEFRDYLKNVTGMDTSKLEVTAGLFNYLESVVSVIKNRLVLFHC